MADVSQIKLPNGSVYDLIDEKSGYITAEYIEDKTDYEIPVSRVGEIVVGETAIGTDSTNFPTSKAVVDYVDERVVQEMDAIDVGVTGITANGTSLTVENGVVNIPAFSSNQSIGLMTEEYMINVWNGIDNVSDLIPTTTSELYNDSGFITLETDPTVPDWAKAPTKPTYTASEVGALPDSTVIPHIFKVIYNSSTNTADKTYTEIDQAYSRGDLVLLLYNGDIYQITNYSWGYLFTTVQNLTSTNPTEGPNAKIRQLKVNSDNTWSAYDYKLPRKTSDLTNDSGYLTASDIASVMTYKGTKANYAALPASGNTTGDVWHLTDTGAEWAWDGSAWQELGTAIDLSGYATKATTLAGYGITDAKIQNGTITLGSNTITPLTSFTETDPTVPSWAKASSKPSYSLTEISGTNDLRVIEGLTGTTGLLKKTAANTWTLDTNTYLTSYTETDPTVPSWAKQSSKPTYTASEVGAMSTSHAANGITTAKINAWDAKSDFSGSYNDLTNKPTIPTVPTNISAFTNDSGYLTSYTETDPTVPSWAKASSKPSYGLTEISGTDDLRAIEALTGTSGFLKKTKANTWTLDTNTYLTSYTETDPTVPSWAKQSSKPSYSLTEISGTDDLRAIEALTGTSGFLKKTAANTWSLDTNTYLTSTSTLNAAKLSGAIPSAVTATTQTAGDNSTKIATTAFVTTAIANLPEPMIFKGSLGTGGTITSLPTAAAANEGYTYKVITAGTYASQAAKIGDTFISDGSSWILIPSGDEPSGTVTNIAAGAGLNTTSADTSTDGGSISSSGTLYLTKSGATAGSYGDSSAQTPGYGSTFKVPYITVDKYGRVTGISEHTVKIPASDNTNTTYTLTNALASHKFTWTFTPSSGSATTTTAELVAGNNITLTDDTTNKKITIAATDTNTHRPIQMNGTEILGNNTTALNLKAGTNVTLSNSGGTVTIASTDTNTWRGIQDNLTSSSTTDSLSANQGRLLANGSARDSTKLEKTTYEYNKEISFGSTGKLLIGKFACYDSNVTITINSTTSTTYSAIAVLATQNINTSGGGTITWNTYGDSANTVTPNLYAKYASGSNVIEIYFSPQSWSKNLIHIQCLGLASGGATNICESIDSIPTEANRQPTNTLINMSINGSAGSVAWSNVSSKPTATGSKVTGISIAAHGTTSVGSASNWSAGTASTWAFEEKTIPNVTSAGTASTWAFEEKTIPNVTSVGSASTWTFEEKTIPNVTSVGSASSWTFEEKSIPNVTAAGSGSASLTFTMDTTDTKKLKIAFSHTHTSPTIGTAIKVQSKSGGSNGTAPTLGTAIKVQSKSGGGNGTAPTLGTAIKVQSKSSGANGTAPTLGTAIKVQSKSGGSNSTVPSLTVTSTTVVTGTTHTITDNGHTHTI